MKFKFSIIVPTLNEEVYLPRLLESLRRQTFRDFEIIIVDANSEDKTVALALQYKKYFPALVIVRSKIRGVSRQRNLGAKKAKGEWFVFLDADTQLLPESLARVNTHTLKRADDLISSWFLGDNTVIDDALAITLGTIWLEILEHSAYPWVPGPFCVIRSLPFWAIDGFKENMRLAEDHDLSIRCVKSGYKFAIIRSPLFRFSFRRLRRFGYLKTAFIYLKSGIGFLTKSEVKAPEFVAGGQLYTTKEMQVKAK